MEFILSQYELFSKLFQYLDNVSLLNLRHSHQQAFCLVKKPKLNRWDKMLLQIQMLNNCPFVPQSSIEIKQLGVRMQVFISTNGTVLLIIQSIEFPSFCKFVHVRCLSTRLKNMIPYFQLMIIPSQLTKSRLPEYWLKGKNFFYQRDRYVPFIRFTHILEPTLHLIPQLSKGFGRFLNFTMFSSKHGKYYDLNFIDNYIDNSYVSNTLDSYWILGGMGNFTVFINNIRSQYQCPPSEKILCIVDDRYIITVSHRDFRCYDTSCNYDYFSFLQKFDQKIVRDVLNFYHMENNKLIPLDIGDNYLCFLFEKKVVLFNIIEMTCQILKNDVQNVYVAGNGILKIENLNSKFETINLNKV